MLTQSNEESRLPGASRRGRSLLLGIYGGRGFKPRLPGRLIVMKHLLVLLSLVVLFVGLPSVVLATPPRRVVETGWTSWEGWPVLVFLLCFGLMIFLIYIALLFTQKK